VRVLIALSSIVAGAVHPPLSPPQKRSAHESLRAQFKFAVHRNGRWLRHKATNSTDGKKHRASYRFGLSPRGNVSCGPIVVT
jgi:hypothetical protein